MIQHRAFGKTAGGEPVEEYTLAVPNGLTARILTYGGILRELWVPDRNGIMADVVLGFNNLESYLAGHPYFSCITGRVAGRLTGAKFSMEGKTYELAVNDPPNHLHGGKVGLDKRVWKAEAKEVNGAPQLRLVYLSPEGEEGYPGNLRISVTYSLSLQSELTVDYEAVTDKATPVNLTVHPYFNLSGEASGSAEDHALQIWADDYAPTNETMTLLGQRKAVAGNDFRQPRRVCDALPHLWRQHGDFYFARGAGLRTVAKLTDPKSGRTMTVATTDPGVQLYTGMGLDGKLIGKAGVKYEKYAGLCLECHGYPNGVNEPHLGNIVLKPGETYRQRTVHQFASV